YLNISETTYDNLSIFPNPTNGSIFIKNGDYKESFNVQLMDINGKIIISKNNLIKGTETTEVNLKTLESGVYLVKVYNENSSKIFRIIKE
ncbi:MAG: hypothetical protein CL844_00005, partial [Crocinitomicaceae bacterium]|nr:hypothetical protein [Crocinitomicaceae bacterium]